MPTPIQFMNLYRKIVVNYEFEDPAAKVCRSGSATVRLNKYFMMNWHADTTQMTHFSAVAAGSSKDQWFKQNRDRIWSAAMGKGAPGDYALALEWAVMSHKITNPSQTTIQTYFDQNLGIDCSGFATNYLIACGKLTNTFNIQQNTSAASYFQPAKAVNDPSRVQSGDLLVLMKNNAVVTGPGHVMVVESYFPGSQAGGNMRVVEATAAAGAHPKLLDSMYSVEKINDKGSVVPCMILDVKRFNTPATVAVIRF